MLFMQHQRIENQCAEIDKAEEIEEARYLQ